MQKNTREAAESHLQPSARTNKSNSINKGIGYALLYIGDQLKDLVQAKEKALGLRAPDGSKPKPGSDLETKG